MDLRDRFDLQRHSSTIKWQLLHAGPTGLDAALSTDNDVTGIDCLVVVIRRLYVWVMMQDDAALLERYREMESQNTMLSYAWQDLLGNDGLAKITKECGSRELRLKQIVIRRLLESMPELTGLSFSDLMSCSAMNSTVWSQDEFILYRAVLTKSETGWDAENWQRSDAVAASVLHFDGTTNLQKFAESQFGWREPNQLWCSNGPQFVRIIYEPRGGTHEFSSLRTFSMPIADLVDDGEGGKICNLQAEWRIYNIAAAVRLRGVGPFDFVRTYRPTGAHILFTPNARSLSPNDWSLSDSSPRFFLLYQLCKSHCPPFPEYSTDYFTSLVTGPQASGDGNAGNHATQHF